VLAISLALGSSLVYGLSDFLGGLKSRSVALLPVLLVSQGTALAVLLVIVIPSGGGPPGDAYLLYAALAGVSEAVGVAALYRGLASGVISVVAPVAATAPLVPVVAGILLGELPAPVQAVGVGLAVAGIVLTACERSGEEIAAAAVAASVRKRSVRKSVPVREIVREIDISAPIGHLNAVSWRSIPFMRRAMSFRARGGRYQ